MGITGLAGCAGSSQDFEGISFNYWNIINIQNRNARDLSEEIIKEFEQETGANVQTSFSGYDDLVGAKWRSAWENNNYPVLYDSITYLAGHLHHKVLPVSEYIDKLDDELVENAQWVLDLMAEETFRGFEGSGLDRVYEMPFGLDVREPNIGRKDHFEEAGVSWEDNMPPEDYEHLVDTMTTVMNEGPANTGYQVYGVDHDWSDVQLVPWQIANAGSDGLYMNEDATEPNFDKDNWIEVFQQYVDIFREHELCGPKTPQMSDEETVPNIISGNWSMGAHDPFNHPSLTRQAPDLANSGDVKYASQFQTDNLPKGGFPWSMVAFGITQKPPGADESEWEQKQDAAIKLMEKFLEEGYQRQSWGGFGTIPVRKGVWDDLERGEHGLLDVLLPMAEETDYSISARPGMGNIYSTLTGPTAQQALRGEITPEEACKQIAEETRQFIEEHPFPSER